MSTSPRIVEVRRNVLKHNDQVAAALRDRFQQAGVFVASLVSSPGSGKTAFLEKTLTLLKERCYRPAAIVGCPVGFVGAAESKAALAADPHGVPFLIVRGRIGGSAMTAAAINALARSGL